MTNNLTWAEGEIRHSYPEWVGIDECIAIALRDYIPSNGSALDVGCGKSSPLGQYRHVLSSLVGTDLGLEDVKSNIDVQSAALANGETLPFLDSQFDFLFSKTVIEHLQNPLQFFGEINRVLKPGGIFVWITSNVKSMPIMVSRLTPLGLHRWVYRGIFGKSLAIEQFPVYYRANTEETINRQLTQTGFKKLTLSKASWPLYFAFNPLLFRLFLPIHRWSDLHGLEWLQVHLIGVYQKEKLYAD